MDASTASAIASACATVGLLIYAGVQTSLQRRAEKKRRQERDEDEVRAVDLALAVVNAEWFRLWTIARNWETGDLVQLAADGQIDSADVEPADWAQLTESLAHLGFATASLAGYALVRARDASLYARKLVSMAREDRHTLAGPVAEKMKENAMEAALLLEDAMAHCPRSRAMKVVDTDIPMKSKTGARIIGELARRSEPGAAQPAVKAGALARIAMALGIKRAR